MKSTLIPIVYVSNANWHYGLPTNRQQLPLRLARSTPVLYVSPFSLSQVLLGSVQLSTYRPGLERIEHNIFLTHAMRLLPMVRGQVWPLTMLDRWFQTRTIETGVRRLGFDHFILWLYFPPSFAYLQDHLSPSLTCYHCTDDHVGYAESLGLETRTIAQAENALVKQVDVVFATSEPLHRKHRILNPNTYLMPNVADVGRFKQVAQGQVSVAPELLQLDRPRVGFVGAVDRYKVDLDLVGAVAQYLPDWSFVFVGPIGTGDNTKAGDLPSSPNLHFLGGKPYAALPSYIAGFDVCIIPYNLNSYTVGVFPLKFWEYLASGKPVVTTPLPALEAYYDEVEVASHPEKFVSALKRALDTSDNNAAIQRRVRLAADQSWEKRAKEMIEVLNKHLS